MHSVQSSTSLSLIYSLLNPWRRILVKISKVALYIYPVSSIHFSNVLLHSLQHNHLSPAIPKKFLKILKFCRPSFEIVSISNLSVTIAAALYTKNMTNGGRKLKSIVSIPRLKGLTALIMAERTEIRDVFDMELQSSVTPAISGTLLPFSNAKRRALVQRQHHRTYPQPQICNGW